MKIGESWTPRAERMSATLARAAARVSGRPVVFSARAADRLQKAYPSGKVISLPFAAVQIEQTRLRVTGKKG